MNLLKIVLIASCAFLAACSSIAYRFEYPLAVVELTNTKCLVPSLQSAPDGLIVRGGQAEVVGEPNKREVCWVEMDGMVVFIDEHGTMGSEPAKKK